MFAPATRSLAPSTHTRGASPRPPRTFRRLPAPKATLRVHTIARQLLPLLLRRVGRHKVHLLHVGDVELGTQVSGGQRDGPQLVEVPSRQPAPEVVGGGRLPVQDVVLPAEFLQARDHCAQPQQLDHQGPRRLLEPHLPRERLEGDADAAGGARVRAHTHTHTIEVTHTHTLEATHTHTHTDTQRNTKGAVRSRMKTQSAQMQCAASGKRSTGV